VFSKIKADTRGGVAVMAGTTFGLFAIAAAAGLDYTNATNERHALQKATDAAVLAGASMAAANDRERLKRAENMFLGSQFCKKQKCNKPRVSMKDGAIAIDGSAMVATSLLQIAGVAEIEVGASSRAVPVTDKPLDVVMVLDYSGSMNGANKYQDMAAAATQFLDSAEAQPGDNIAVGVVPFSKYVLTPMQGRYLFDVSAGVNLMGQTVVGCILNREHPHSTNVAEPSTATTGSLWPVFSYSVGSSPGSGTYSPVYTAPVAGYSTGTYNYTVNGVDFTYELSMFDNDPSTTPSSVTANYTHDPVTGVVNGMQFDAHGKFNVGVTPLNGQPFSVINQGPAPVGTADPFAAYGGYGGSTGWSVGDDSGLPTVYDQSLLAENLSGDCGQYATNSLWVRTLNKDFTTLKTAISAMRPIGLTNIALGLDVGWHLLTPEAPFDEASAPDENPSKVVILLTDGVQTVSAHGAGGAVSIGSANSNITESCEAMKSDEVEVFTIAFAIQDAHTRTLLENCASGPAYFFEPSAGGDLDAVFEGIFNKIISGQVRLTG